MAAKEDDSGGTWAGATVRLRLSTTLAARQRNDGGDQVDLIDPNGAFTVDGTLDGNSLATFDFGPNQFPPGNLPSNLTNIFAQLEVTHPRINGEYFLSNVVTVPVIR